MIETQQECERLLNQLENWLDNGQYAITINQAFDALGLIVAIKSEWANIDKAREDKFSALENKTAELAAQKALLANANEELAAQYAGLAADFAQLEKKNCDLEARNRELQILNIQLVNKNDASEASIARPGRLHAKLAPNHGKLARIAACRKIGMAGLAASLRARKQEIDNLKAQMADMSELISVASFQATWLADQLGAKCSDPQCPYNNGKPLPDTRACVHCWLKLAEKARREANA